jgi:hypothetical protein
LAHIHQEIDTLKGSINIIRSARFIPSTTSKVMLEAVERLEVGSLHTLINKHRADGVPSLPQLKGKSASIADVLLENLKESAKRYDGLNSSLNLWEILVLADTTFDMGGQMPLLMSSNVHSALTQSSFPVLPYPVDGAELFQTEATADTGSDSGWYSIDADDEETKVTRADIGVILANVIYIAARENRPLRLHDITLPISVLTVYPMLVEIFSKGYRAFFPEVESEFFKYFKLMATRSTQTMRTLQVLADIDNAVLRDASNIPSAFLQKFELGLNNHMTELLDSYFRKKYVYDPLIYAPHDRTTFRTDTTVQDLRNGQPLEVLTDFPVLLLDRYIVSKPAGSDEAILLSNKMNKGAIFKGVPVGEVTPLLETYFQHVEPIQNTIRLNYNMEDVEGRIAYDIDNNIVRDFRKSYGAGLRLSDVVQGAPLSARDDMEILRESTTNIPILLKSTETRLEMEQKVFHYPKESIIFGAVRGVLATPSSLLWTEVMTNIVTRIYGSYMGATAGTVEKEIRVQHLYENRTYLKRKSSFSSLFTKVNFTDYHRFERFLSHYLVSQVVGDKLDLSVFDVLQRADLWVNTSLDKDIRTYATAVARAVKENFNEKGKGVQTFIDFIDGKLNESDMIKLKMPAVGAVVSAMLKLTMEHANKENTYITLILLRRFVEAMSLEQSELPEPTGDFGYEQI